MTALRPAWQALLLLAMIAAAALAISLHDQLRNRAAALPVSVTVTARESAAPVPIFIGHVSLRGVEAPLTQEGGKFTVSAAWVRSLRLHLPEDWQNRLAALRVEIGAKVFVFDAAALAGQWRSVPANETRSFSGAPTVLESPDDLRAEASLLPPLAGVINWPGDLAFALGALWWPLAVAAVAGAAALASRRWNLTLPLAPAAAGHARLWFAAGCAAVIALFVLLQILDPFYFVQEDNLRQFLPVTTLGCEALAQGQWPDFNPYQLLGAPAASDGTYALTYPVMWASCGIASALGDIHATYDVFALLHVLAGYCFAFWFGRLIGLRPALAAAQAFAFVGCGYFLIAGRAWFYMMPVATFLPALMATAVLLARQAMRPLPWVLGTGALIGVSFHSGNVQMWCYTNIFFVLALLVMWGGGALTWRRALLALPAILLGLGIAAPLLVPQAQLTFDIVGRFGGRGEGILNALPDLFLPLAAIEAYVTGQADLLDDFWPRTVIYGGTLLTLAGFATMIAGIGAVIARRQARTLLRANPWIVLAFAAFLFALGHKGGLWSLMAQVPPFTFFNVPMKFTPYVVFFFGAAGALTIERWRAQPRWAASAMAVAVAVLIFFNAAAPQRGAPIVMADDPYPPLAPEVVQMLAPDGGAALRVYVISVQRSPEPGFVSSLNLNFATALRISALHGYDPLIEAQPENLAAAALMQSVPAAALSAYGVKWIALHSDNPAELDGDPAAIPWLPPAERVLAPLMKFPQMVLRADKTAFYLLPKAPQPYAFSAGEPSRAFPLRFEPARAIVNMGADFSGSEVTLNFLLRKGTRVTAGDGREIPLHADEWGRIVAEVPAGTAQLTVGYTADWKSGILLGLVLLFAGAVAFVALRRFLPEKVETVLIHHLGSIGDTVIALPAYHLIARAFPDAKRVVLTNLPRENEAHTYTIIAPTGLVSDFIDYRAGERSSRVLRMLARKIRTLNPDLVICLAEPRGLLAAYRDYLFYAACGIRRAIGLPLTPSHQHPQKNGKEWESEARRRLRRLAPLGQIDLGDPTSWDLHLTSKERANAARVLAPFMDQPFIAVCAGAKIPAKDWGEENWKAWSETVARDLPDARVVFVGTQTESPRAHLGGAAFGGRALNFCGALSPRETAAVLERARCFVGHDGGPMHLAAACGTPCVALFGSYNKPGVWHPCGKGHVIFHENSLAEISPARVSAATVELFKVNRRVSF